MAGNTARRSSVFHCLEREPATILLSKAFCIFWLSKCNRNPCRFLHSEIPVLCTKKQSHTKLSSPDTSEDALKKSYEDISHHHVEELNIEEGGSNTSEDALKKSFGDISCHHMEELRALVCLQGHTKAVMGIALPERNNKLYLGCSDGKVCIWDCAAAQCARGIDLGTEIGLIISEGDLFTRCGAEYDLDGFTGLIYAMETIDDMLFAGGQDDIILAWRGSFETNLPLQPVSSLQGHTHDVVSLAVVSSWLYSGSKDHTIRMAAKTARRSLIFHRLGREPATISPSKAVCIFWLNGKCNRNPYRFFHSEIPVLCAKSLSHTKLSGPEKKKPTYIRYKRKFVLEKSHEDVGPKDWEKEALKKFLPLNIEEGGSNTSEDALKKSSKDISCHRVEESNIEEGGSNTSEDALEKSSGDISCHHVEELRTLVCLQGHMKAVMGFALHFLKETTCFTQAVVMEKFVFGTALQHIVLASLTLVLRLDQLLVKVVWCSLVCEML